MADEEDLEIGPALPPHLAQRKRDQAAAAAAAKRKLEPEPDTASDPTTTQPTTTTTTTATTSTSDDADGHAAKRRRVMGPDLGLLVASQPRPPTNGENDDDDDGPVIGPVLPPGDANAGDDDDDDDDDDVQLSPTARLRPSIGPLPPIARRSSATDKDAREDWMLSLPSGGFINNTESKSRQFSVRGVSRASEQERSGWTDTPADRERRAREARERTSNAQRKEEFDYTAYRTSSSDAAMRSLMADYDAQRRSRSLVDEHIERAKAAPAASQVRTPFDREEMIRRPVSASERDRMVQEAAVLNSRFSQATTAKRYL